MGVPALDTDLASGDEHFSASDKDHVCLLPKRTCAKIIFGYSRLFSVISFPKPAALRDIQAHRTGNVYDACSQGQGNHHNTGLEDAKRGLKHCNRPAMGTHGWR